MNRRAELKNEGDIIVDIMAVTCKQNRIGSTTTTLHPFNSPFPGQPG